MRDPTRIDKVLKDLGGIWKQYPDLRLGQLIINQLIQRSKFKMKIEIFLH